MFTVVIRLYCVLLKIRHALGKRLKSMFETVLLEK